MPDHHWQVSFVLLDNHHLSKHGVSYFCALSKEFVLVTSNPKHPAFSVKEKNLHILYYEKLNMKEMLCDLYEKYGCKRLTVQSGSTLNAEFLHEHLFDYADIVIAPVLVGGEKTSSLIGGESFISKEQLDMLGVLGLEKAETMENSYLRLKYKVRK
jgi:2,5-diamino-6-(ribosylamino)-4(3H)-pyrimidinone 5'-phosphate reductase